MTKLSKYRRLSIFTMSGLVIAWLLSLASLWNSLMNTETKNEGWFVFFMILVFLAGIFLFFIAYINSDTATVERIRKEAFESGKSEVMLELEKKLQAETEEKTETADTKKVVESILGSIHAVRSENGLCTKLLSAMGRELGLVQGIIYILDKKENIFNPVGEYALTERKPEPFKPGETLPGQAAASKTMTILYDIPENYFIVSSGLGSSQPRYLMLVPVVHNDQSIAVMELAAFKKPDAFTHKILETILPEVGSKLNKLITV